MLSVSESFCICELTPWAAESYYVFFFSSRRRHTRFDCDWSSDVCSSDLSAVAQARATLSQAQAGLSKANTDVARLRPLAERNAVSRQDLDHAVAAEQGAEGQVAAARAAMKTAQLNLDYAKITSPITGLAGVAQADVGSLVGSPGPTLLTVVSQVDTIKVKFRISEQEYLTLVRALGDSVRTTRPRGEARLELVLADGSVYGSKGRVVTLDRSVYP